MINQFNEDLNDAFEVHFPPMSWSRKWLFKRLTNLTLWGLAKRVEFFEASTVVTERVVEYTTILTWLPEKGARILDIGCVSSRLPIQLASLGYDVHALDVRPYRYSHSGVTFHQQDLFLWNSELRFDTVYLISVLEHVGLGGYGDSQRADADRQAVHIIMTLMAPGGHLVVSVPFGRRGQTPKHRIYDMSQLLDLFADFEWCRSAFYARSGKDWLPSAPDDLAEVISPHGVVNGVAVLDLVQRD